jgi:hypothetical protein
MADQLNEWACPWGICNHGEAQECRTEMNPRKGCGGRFPDGMTPTQAALAVRPWLSLDDALLDMIIRLAVDADHFSAEDDKTMEQALRTQLRVAIYDAWSRHAR